MVGASHASRTTDALAASGQTVTKLTQPGWRITRPKVADMASKLHQLLEKEGADCTVVFEMLDSNFFLAKTEEGGMVPIRRRGSGEFHVDWDLVFAPKELQYSVFCDAIPLLELVGGRKTIIVSPIPRYLVLGCCPDPDHAGNRSSPDFRCGPESAQKRARDRPLAGPAGNGQLGVGGRRPPDRGGLLQSGGAGAGSGQGAGREAGAGGGEERQAASRRQRPQWRGRQERVDTG